MIQQYLAELAKIQLLSPQEEQSLWRQYKIGHIREARQRLIESYQPLVYKIASRLAGPGDLLFDLIQEGTVGLIEATESYNPAQAVKFSTFAPHRIRGRMIDFLKRHNAGRGTLEIALYEEEFEQFLTRVADPSTNIEDEVTTRLIADNVNAALAKLNPKEQKVIRDLYLLEKEPGVSAQEMNISLSYLYKLQKKALQRLRGMLAKLRAEIKASG